MNIKLASTLAALALSMSLMGVPFQNLKFNQEMDVQSLDAVNKSMKSTNGLVVVSSMENWGEHQYPSNVNGVVFKILEDGVVRFDFDEDPVSEPPTERLIINGIPLNTLIDQKIQAAIVNNLDSITKSSMTGLVQRMVYNPLWGKKLAVIGDSLTSTPTLETSYPYYIAQRNEMVLVHNGQPGKCLCTDKGTNIAAINQYTNVIPADADFILCHIGANDHEIWTNGLINAVSDTTLDTTTFKGCWNSLLIGLKTHYPNAKLGIILPNDFAENLGMKSEDTPVSGVRREMVQWQKMQCQMLNIPVFDPVEDTRQFTYHYKQYRSSSETPVDDLALDWYDRTKRQIGTDHAWYKTTAQAWLFQTQYMKDTQHMTENGNMLLSFFVEQWMKTTLMAN